MATPFLSLVSTLVETLLESSHPVLNRNPYADAIVLVLRSYCRIAFLSGFIGRLKAHLTNQPIVKLSNILGWIQAELLAEGTNILLIMGNDLGSPAQSTQGFQIKAIRIITERI